MKLHMQGTKGKKLYIGNELLGIERRGSPILTKEKRASHMKNLLCVDGINRKRNGWREIYHFRDGRDKDLKINGIYEYKGKEIFHAGEYLLNGGIKVGTLADKKSCGFENNGLLYIVCAGELFIYDGNMLKNAYDSVYSYIPLTTKNISPIGTESIAKEEQSPSLITPKRINTLIGDKSERKKYRLKRINQATSERHEIKLDAIEDAIAYFVKSDLLLGERADEAVTARNIYENMLEEYMAKNGDSGIFQTVYSLGRL